MKNRAVIPVPKIEEDGYDWYARHENILQLQRENQYELVLIGDSITHNWSGEGRDFGIENWRKNLAKYKVLNMGFGFDRTQNVLWRLDHGELHGQDPKLIVLNIGTNQFSVSPNYDGDTPEDAAEGIIAVLDKIRSICPKTKIILMGLFPREPERAFFEPRITGVNRILKEAASVRPNVVFLDLRDRFLNPDGSQNKSLYVDLGCHPNNAGYQVWAEALFPYFREVGLSEA